MITTTTRMRTTNPYTPSKSSNRPSKSDQEDESGERDKRRMLKFGFSIPLMVEIIRSTSTSTSSPSQSSMQSFRTRSYLWSWLKFRFMGMWEIVSFMRIAVCLLVIGWFLRVLLLSSNGGMTGGCTDKWIDDKMFISCGHQRSSSPLIKRNTVEISGGEWNPAFVEVAPGLKVILTTSMWHTGASHSKISPHSYPTQKTHRSSRNAYLGAIYMTGPERVWPSGLASDVSQSPHSPHSSYLMGESDCKGAPFIEFQPLGMSSVEMKDGTVLLAVVAYSRDEFSRVRHAIELFNVTTSASGTRERTVLGWTGFIHLEQPYAHSAVKIVVADDGKVSFITSSDAFASNNRFNAQATTQFDDQDDEQHGMSPILVYLNKLKNFIFSFDPNGDNRDKNFIFSFDPNGDNRDGGDAELDFVKRYYYTFGTVLNFTSHMLQWTGIWTSQINIISQKETGDGLWSIVESFDLDRPSQSIDVHENHVYFIDSHQRAVCRELFDKNSTLAQPLCTQPVIGNLAAFTIMANKRDIAVLVSDTGFWKMEYCLISGMTQCHGSWSIRLYDSHSLAFKKTIYNHDGFVYGSPTEMKAYDVNTLIVGSKLNPNLAIISM